MIKLNRKPLQEIKGFLDRYTRVMNVGCGGCASVCLAGGQKEVRILNEDLRLAMKQAKRALDLDEHTVERACNAAFFGELDSIIGSYDCIISMACSAGVQFIAERYPAIPVFPAINTQAIGVDRDVGVYEEKCKACGDCLIGYTGGICPLVNCAKKLFNGPCGGTNLGSCEVDRSVDCAWQQIFLRLKEQGRLEDILKIKPPMEWRDQVKRTIVQEDYT